MDCLAKEVLIKPFITALSNDRRPCALPFEPILKAALLLLEGKIQPHRNRVALVRASSHSMAGHHESSQELNPYSSLEDFDKEQIVRAPTETLIDLSGVISSSFTAQSPASHPSVLKDPASPTNWRVFHTHNIAHTSQLTCRKVDLIIMGRQKVLLVVS